MRHDFSFGRNGLFSEFGKFVADIAK